MVQRGNICGDFMINFILLFFGGVFLALLFVMFVFLGVFVEMFKNIYVECPRQQKLNVKENERYEFKSTK